MTTATDDQCELAALLGLEELGPEHIDALRRGRRLAEANPQVAIAALILGATNFPCDEVEPDDDEPTTLASPPAFETLVGDDDTDCEDDSNETAPDDLL